jgi:glycosyltransferase involved in cell wall biosynthesis
MLLDFNANKGLIFIAIITIIAVVVLTFWRQMWSELRRSAREEYDLALKTADLNKRGIIVWLMRAYLPNVKAGAEITAHAVNKYLVSRGWRVIVVVHDYQVPVIDGVECVAFGQHEAVLDQATLFFCQNYDTRAALQLLEPYGRPVVFFLHIDKEKQDILQTRFAVPIGVVYNSLTQKEVNPTVHPNTIVRPFIPFELFKPRARAQQAGPITLLNCNENKGGKVLQRLAAAMRDVPFMGVAGAYSEQLTSGATPNLHYKPLQDDPRPIYEEAGIVIMPSRSESWGRVALEAMASGIPVIVSRAPGLRECTAGAAVAYCQPDDLGCWSEAIRRLRSDGMAYREAVAAGLRRIEELKKADDFAEFEDWLVRQIAGWIPNPQIN